MGNATLADILTTEAANEIQGRVLDDWDAAMRAIGRMLVERHSRKIWRDTYRVFVEKQGLAYEAGDEAAFLNEADS